MIMLNSLHVPTATGCAQCGAPIAEPDWVEVGDDKLIFVWHCQACDCEFETVTASPPTPLAA